jgi:spore coat protein CotH
VTRNLVWRASLIAVLAVASPALASEDELFDSSAIQEINLLMNARDLRSLREHFNENTYYPADLQWRDVRVRNVGVRSRGLGSRNPTKLGLRVDFNRYVSGQRFAGSAALVLDNLWQDASMIREAAAMSFITRMGEAASRESFAKVYINGELEGLYAVIEEPNAGYLTRHFGDDSGVLFEYHWLRPYHFDSLGDDLDEYERMFERRTHERAAAPVIYEPLRAMIESTSQPLDTAWREHVDPYVDLPQMIRYAAIEAFLADVDGFTGYDGINNFYMYRPPDSERHIFLPWDRDHAFWQVDMSIFNHLDGNRLLYNALAHPDLRTLYLQTIERCAAAASEDGWLEGEVTRLATLVASAGALDPTLPYTQQMHDDDVQMLLDFARRRSALTLDEVGRARVEVARRRR